MSGHVGGSRLGNLCVLVACLAVGCTQGGDTSEDQLLDAPELRSRKAALVLGFESMGVWKAEGRDVAASLVPIDGKDALQLTIADRAWLTSAGFQFMKTPNLVEFSVRAPESATAKNHRGYAQAYLSCLGRKIAREPVGRVELGSLVPGEFKRIALVVPESVQTSLAGGCEQLQVDIAIDVGSAPGTYVLDQLKLRAKTPPIVLDSTPLCGLPEMAELAPNALESSLAFSLARGMLSLALTSFA